MGAIIQLIQKAGPLLSKLLPYILKFFQKKQETQCTKQELPERPSDIVEPIVNSTAQPEVEIVDPIIHVTEPIKEPQVEEFTKDVLYSVVCSTPQAIKGWGPEAVNTFFPHLREAMIRSEINSTQRIAHFMAQIMHESGALKYTEEIATGAAYEGRKDLGNINPGDGVKFKGRGLIQLTGSFNYDKVGRAFGEDFLTGTNNRRLSEPRWAALSAGWFWIYKKDKFGKNLNDFADQDDLLKITYFVNGGFNGLDDRLRYYKVALEALKVKDVDNRIEKILKEIESNIQMPERTTNKQKALFKKYPTLGDVDKLRKFLK